MSECVHLPFWEIGKSADRRFESRRHIFESWLSQINYFKIDNCRSLAWWLALLGYGKDWFTQCKDNATDWDSSLWCQ